MRFLTTKRVPIEDLDTLWASIGWKKRKSKWIEVLEKSSFILSVWDDRKLVGFGRILEDGVMCMFYDIGVHPDYQGRHSVGPKIMDVLVSQVKNMGYASIGLFAWEPNKKNNMRFYKKFGFKEVDTGMELTKYMERE